MLTLVQRLESKVDFDGPGGCWDWIGGRRANGYGQIQVMRAGRRGTRAAHCAVYETLIGEIPAGMQLDHTCRRRQCVNPAHLEPVTGSENIARGLHGALRTCCAHGHVLTEANTYRPPGRPNKRMCRTCRRAQRRRKD